MSRDQSVDMKPGYGATLHPQNGGCNPVLRFFSGRAAEIRARPNSRIERATDLPVTSVPVRTSSKWNVDPVRLVPDRKRQPRGRRGRIGDRPAGPDPAFARLVYLHRDPF